MDESDDEWETKLSAQPHRDRQKSGPQSEPFFIQVRICFTFPFVDINNRNPHPVLNPYFRKQKQSHFCEDMALAVCIPRSTSSTLVVGDGCGEGSSSSSFCRPSQCGQDQIDPHWWSRFLRPPHLSAPLLLPKM
jgi:hypothetical protein